MRITGTAFFILTAGLLGGAALNIYYGKRSETRVWGIAIALVSILTMWLLTNYKLKVGKKLNSPAIIADANCTQACMYLSLILLISSAGFELTGIGGFDLIGATGIAIMSFKEGREAFQKAKGLTCGCK